MVQPNNYMLNVADPLDRAFQGYATGLNAQAGQQELAMNAAREKRAAELQPFALEAAEMGLAGQQQGLDIRAAQEGRAATQFGMDQTAAQTERTRQEEFSATMADLAALGNDATQEDYTQAMLKFPESADMYSEIWQSIDAEKRRGYGEILGQAALALKSGDIERAKEIGTRFRDAAQNSNNEQQAQAADAMLQLMEVSPEGAMVSLRMMLTQNAPDIANQIFAGGNQEPAEVQSLRIRAEGAGLVPGTPEYESFMLNGGGDPSNFRALDMQARAAGFEPGTPEYAEFMATRGAGDQARARTTATNIADAETGFDAEAARAAGRATGANQVASDTELAAMQRNMPNLIEVADQLYDLSNTATYTLAGRARDEAAKALGLGAPQGAIDRATYIAVVDNQVLPLLKETFGAAFTETEGARLSATLGDPNKSPEEKRAVLRAFIAQKQRDLEARGGDAGEPWNPDDITETPPPADTQQTPSYLR